MKKCKIFLFRTVSIVVLAFLAAGCLEYTVTTRVLHDGSIERTVLVKGDSAKILQGSLPVPFDSTWQISAGYESVQSGDDSTTKKQYVYKAVKIFRNSADLNMELNQVSEGEARIIRNVKVEKKFRWFNTFYRYTETYKQTFPFYRKPVDDFISDEELEVAFADDKELYYSKETDNIVIIKDTLERPALSEKDSIRMNQLKAAVENKFKQWLLSNIYEDYFEVLKEALNTSGVLRHEETEKTRDGLFAFFNENITDPLSFFDKAEISGPHLLLLASRYYQIDTSRLYKANLQGFRTFNKKIDNILPIFGDSYANLAIMPGTIISSNSTEINGSTASWDVKSDRFYAKDYTLSAESKKTNKGPVIVSGALVLFLIIGFSAGIIRNFTGRKANEP